MATAAATHSLLLPLLLALSSALAHTTGAAGGSPANPTAAAGGVESQPLTTGTGEAETAEACPAGGKDCGTGCCTVSDGVCCGDGTHCCPSGYTCPAKGRFDPRRQHARSAPGGACVATDPAKHKWMPWTPAWNLCHGPLQTYRLPNVTGSDAAHPLFFQYYSSHGCVEAPHCRTAALLHPFAPLPLCPVPRAPRPFLDREIWL